MSIVCDVATEWQMFDGKDLFVGNFFLKFIKRSDTAYRLLDNCIVTFLHCIRQKHRQVDDKC